MKNLLEINPIPLTCSIKKLIFVFILLLILPFTGCKSVVKETVVDEPVRIVSPNGDVYVGGNSVWETTWARNNHLPKWKKVCWGMEGWVTKWSRNINFP